MAGKDNTYNPNPEFDMDRLQLEGLLMFLRDSGFLVTPDTFLQASQVALLLGGESTWPDLKYLLSPIFSTSLEEQQRFHESFDQYFAAIGALSREQSDQVFGNPEGDSQRGAGTGSAPLKPTRKPLSFWQYLLAILVIFSLSLVGMGIWQNDMTLLFIGMIWSLLVGFGLGTNSKSFMIVVRRILNWKEKEIPAKDPPFTFDLVVDPPQIDILETQEALQLNRTLQRQIAEAYNMEQIDVKETLHRTIRKAGFIDLAFQPLANNLKYLLLIDKAEMHAHQIAWIDYVYEILQGGDTKVERYYFDYDPHFCYDETNLRTPLQQIYAGQRMLYLGKGESLVDVADGQLHHWVDDFFNLWSEKALLTNRPVQEWGLAEDLLDRLFEVAPSSLEGLVQTVETFDQLNDMEVARWKEEYAADVLHSDQLGLIKSQVGEAVFHWLCACAIYPKIQWNLTLQIGAVLETYPGQLLQKQAITQINSLKWFRQGQIPHDIRLMLLDELPFEKELLVRRTILELLQNQPNLPPPGSYARDEYDLLLLRQAYPLLDSRSEKLLVAGKIRELLVISETDDLELKQFEQAFPSQGMESLATMISRQRPSMISLAFDTIRVRRAISKWMQPFLRERNTLIYDAAGGWQEGFVLTLKNNQWFGHPMPTMVFSMLLEKPGLEVAAAKSSKRWTRLQSFLETRGLLFLPANSPWEETALPGLVLRKEERPNVILMLRQFGLPELLLELLQSNFELVYFQFSGFHQSWKDLKVLESTFQTWATSKINPQLGWDEFVDNLGNDPEAVVFPTKMIFLTKVELGLAWVPKPLRETVVSRIENKQVLQEKNRLVFENESGMLISLEGKSLNTDTWELADADFVLPTEIQLNRFQRIVEISPEPNFQNQALSDYLNPEIKRSVWNYLEEGDMARALNEAQKYVAGNEEAVQAIQRFQNRFQEIEAGMDQNAYSFERAMIDRQRIAEELMLLLNQLDESRQTDWSETEIREMLSGFQTQPEADDIFYHLKTATMFARDSDQSTDFRILMMLLHLLESDSEKERWLKEEEQVHHYGQSLIQQSHRMLALLKNQLEETLPAESGEEPPVYQQQTGSYAAENFQSNTGFEQQRESNELEAFVRAGKELIGKAEEEELLKILLNRIQPGTSNYAELILLNSQFKDIKKRKQTGVISFQESSQAENRIRLSLLKFLDRLDFSDIQNPVNYEEPKSKNELDAWKVQFRDLIGEAREKKVIEELGEILRPESTAFSELILLKYRAERVQNGEINGNISFEKINLESNRIRYSLLEFINQLGPEDLNKSETTSKEGEMKKNLFWTSESSFFELLLARGPEEKREELYRLQESWMDLQKRNLSGMLSFEDFSLESNKVLWAALQILDRPDSYQMA